MFNFNFTKIYTNTLERYVILSLAAGRTLLSQLQGSREIFDFGGSHMPPQTEHKYTRHSKSQRNTILACAEELFIQRGVENVTMSNLAEAAGMTRATLYR